MDINKSNIKKEVESNDMYIGLINHDESIKYYFDTVIQPKVDENNKIINVPIIYGSPEKWKSIQKDGYLRDKQGKIMLPVIMYRRTNIEFKNELRRHLDGNNPQIYQQISNKYSYRNQYDKFNIIKNQIPQYESTNIVVPLYVKLSYECIIWCNLITQLNEIQESILYTANSYWGDMKTFRFYTKIDSMNSTTEISQGEDKIVKSSFDISLDGFLIPHSMQKQLSFINKINYNKTKIKLTESIS